jgi:hypothetical protein
MRRPLLAQKAFCKRHSAILNEEIPALKQDVLLLRLASRTLNPETTAQRNLLLLPSANTGT